MRRHPATGPGGSRRHGRDPSGPAPADGTHGAVRAAHAGFT
ncbi:hypothetical protein C7S13_0971 [Burkholderia cepacia]|nr:hypothetical protein [Burkholderia cepacia]QOH31832.1 hypothetical protein C7S14_6749 [Burkholderia cepacia]